ncbi:MAG: hypothetical protein OWQ51_04140 [Pyrobaculum arsenaticum]|uniref:Family 59 protein n=2 Tax=Pyrobaculum arsenaticum TaxID=121277 RepID=A4WKM6_PYRAR|nr:hypothetical protein [Pyrobaculum arsenaticum]ABP50943.1 family 59 protein [Pyrobaculum arsenaticum DSM 13514]MCY0890162.1 hypothetical protein [Pyrobaculum arsenaticum]NYR15335.1 hypothetical protein [Pyrobaculum arsenaticum]
MLRAVLFWALVLVIYVMAAPPESVGKPQLICIDAAEAGFKGSPPFIGAYVVNRGEKIPSQIYTNGTVIRIIGVWEANSTNPSVRNITVLPTELFGLICFQPGETRPARVKKGVYIEVEARGRRHGVTIVDVRDEPMALPPLPLTEDFELIRGRVVARREVASEETPAEGAAERLGPPPLTQPAFQLIQPSQSLFRDFSGTIIASFKLRNTDGYVISSQTARGSCATGRFILPNGTSWVALVFSPATRAEVYGGASELWLYITADVYRTDGTYLGSLSFSGAYYPNVYRIPNPPRPWHILIADLSQWRDIDKEIRIRICNEYPVYGRYIIDAFIYTAVPAKSYGEPFALESPGKGTTIMPYSADILYNGTYLAIPGFTPPPGYALGSARAVITLRTCSPNPPASINIYWGPLYIGTISRMLGTDGCWYYVVMPTMLTGAWDVAVRSSLYIGGSLHAIFVGPFDTATYSSGITIQNFRVEGIYRPEMNARTSSIFRDYAVNWLYYTASAFGSYFDYNMGTVYYGSKVNVMITERGSSYIKPHVLISVSKYEGMFHCGRIEISVRAYSNGVPVMLSLHGLPAAYQESASGQVISYLDIVVDFISNIFEETAKRASSVLKVISWAIFAIDLLQSASGVDIVADTSDPYVVRYIIRPGPFAPSAIAIDGASIASYISLYQPVVYEVGVYMWCLGDRYYDNDESYLDGTPITLSTQNIHIFRTFTCGKQEIGNIYVDKCTPSSYG